MDRTLTIAQIVLDGASEYERKSQRIDAAALAASFTVVADPAAADLAHIYGPSPLPAAAVRRIAIPWVASAAPLRRRFDFRRAPLPRAILTPLRGGYGEFVPEAVEDAWFERSESRGTSADDARAAAATSTVGSFARHAVLPMVEQTLARLRRFRDDVSWRLFDRAPSPSDLEEIDVWVDPAPDAGDFDGFVAEALVAGLRVVATRTPINEQRLEKGRIGLLVPPSDPNEMTHAILAALFKPEIAEAKREAARQTVSKFRSRQRLRALERIYGTISG